MNDGDNWKWFLLNGSIRGLLAGLITLTVCAMYVLYRQAPIELIGMLGLVLGNYFKDNKK